MTMAAGMPMTAPPSGTGLTPPLAAGLAGKLAARHPGQLATGQAGTVHALAAQNGAALFFAKLQAQLTQVGTGEVSGAMDNAPDPASPETLGTALSNLPGLNGGTTAAAAETSTPAAQRQSHDLVAPAPHVTAAADAPGAVRANAQIAVKNIQPEDAMATASPRPSAPSSREARTSATHQNDRAKESSASEARPAVVADTILPAASPMRTVAIAAPIQIAAPAHATAPTAASGTDAGIVKGTVFAAMPRVSATGEMAHGKQTLGSVAISAGATPAASSAHDEGTGTPANRWTAPREIPAEPHAAPAPSTPIPVRQHTLESAHATPATEPGSPPSVRLNPAQNAQARNGGSSLVTDSNAAPAVAAPSIDKTTEIQQRGPEQASRVSTDETLRSAAATNVAPSIRTGAEHAAFAAQRLPQDAPDHPPSPEAAKASPKIAAESSAATLTAQGGPHSLNSPAAVPVAAAEVRTLPVAPAAAPVRSVDVLHNAPAPHPPASGDVFAALDAEHAPSATWTHAGPQRAEAGYLDPALGWVGVRAESTGSAMHASIVPASADAAQVLGTHLAGLNAYMSDHHAASGVSLAATDNTGWDNAANAGQGMGQDSTNRGNAQQQSKQDTALPAAWTIGPSRQGSVPAGMDSGAPGMRNGTTISLVA